MGYVNRKTVMQARLQQVVDVLYAGNETAAAEGAGVLQSTLHRILAGTTIDPKVSTLQLLADGFGVPVEWLMEQPELSAPPEDVWIDRYDLPDWFVLLYRQWRKRTRGLRERQSETGLRAHTPYAKELVTLLTEGPQVEPEGNSIPDKELSDSLSAVIREYVNNDLVVPDKLMPLVRADLEADALRLEMLAAELRRLARKGEITYE